MQNEVEDYLLSKQADLGITIAYADIDEVFDTIIRIAERQY
jgi:hypothetical protein